MTSPSVTRYLALIYECVPDHATRREPHRAAHLALVRDYHERGDIVMAGALDEPLDAAILVFREDARAAAEAFAAADPYVINGLVRKWQVRPWNVVVP